jgi:hypothetical protein
MRKPKPLYPYKGNTYRHIALWVEANGPVPDGYELHHIDHDPKNSNLANLMLVTHGDHMRIHAGFRQTDGVWHKRCRDCGEWKPLTDYYLTSKSIFHLCKPCSGNVARAYQRRVRSERGGSHRCPECGDVFLKPNALAIHRKCRHGIKSQRDAGRCG